jgi:hypothetical protein
VSAHEFLREDFATFEPGGCPGWPEDGQSTRCKNIREPVNQGLLGSHHGQIDFFVLRKVGELIEFSGLKIDFSGQLLDAGIG